MSTLRKQHAIALAKAYNTVGAIHMEMALEHCRAGDPMATYNEVTKYRTAANNMRRTMLHEGINHEDLYE